MSKGLKGLFLVHAVVALVFGVPLLAAPGQFLGAFGWAPIDPLLSRVLGAALIALAWSSWRAYRADNRAQAAVLIELEAAFATLAGIGLLRHLLIANWPLMVWAVLFIFAAFAVAWIVALLRK